MKNVHKDRFESDRSIYNNFDVAGMVENMNTKVVFNNYTNEDLTHNDNELDAFGNLPIACLEIFSSRTRIGMSWDMSKNKVLVDIKYKGGVKVNFLSGIVEVEEFEFGGHSDFNFQKFKFFRIVDKS